jgi:hypothetical protein
MSARTRASALLTGAAVLSVIFLWDGAARAQTPPAAKKAQPEAKKAPVNVVKPPVYNWYQPSERLRTRLDLCMKDEDLVGAKCAKKCDKGYIAVDEKGSPRRCRSEQPLKPGEAPLPYRKQQAAPPAPHAPAARKPGA